MIAPNRVAATQPETHIHLHLPARLAEALMQLVVTVTRQRELHFSDPTTCTASASQVPLSAPASEDADCRPLTTRQTEVPNPIPADPGPVLMAPPLRRASDRPMRDHGAKTLEQLYRDLLLPAEERANEPETIRQDLAFIREFEAWAKTDTRNIVPRVGLEIFAERRTILHDFARWFRGKPTGSGEDMCNKSLSAIRKLCKACVAEGLLPSIPSRPSKGEVTLMGRHLFSETEEADCQPVTVDEFRQMRACLKHCGLVWPIVGGRPAWMAWDLMLTFCFYSGIRRQDGFSLMSKKLGLVWSGILADPQCPKLPDLQNPTGWIWILIHKTKKKDAKKKRSPRLLIPNAPQILDLLNEFRGVHSEQVLPLPQNSHSFSREFAKIKACCGLDDATRQRQGKPIIRLTEGKRSIANFRKGASEMWADHVNEEAATYMLKHAISDSGDVSATTRAHYLKLYRALKKITPAVPTLPMWLPSG